MSLPPRYSGMPTEEQHNYFRDRCIEFKKILKTTKDEEELELEMQRFIDAAKQMNWPQEKSAIYHKNEYEKAVQKVWKEFKRYIEGLKNEKTNAQDLIEAIISVETLIDKLKVR